MYLYDANISRMSHGVCVRAQHTETNTRIYMYICVCVINTWIYIYIYIYIYIFIYDQYMDIYNQYMDTYEAVYTYIHTHTHTYIHTYIHTYHTHTYIHTYIHTYTNIAVTQSYFAYAGADPHIYSTSLFALNTSAEVLEWERVNSQYAPEASIGAAMAATGETLWLFGGAGTHTCMRIYVYVYVLWVGFCMFV
jgi:hypothetical protein